MIFQQKIKIIILLFLAVLNWPGISHAQHQNSKLPESLKSVSDLLDSAALYAENNPKKAEPFAIEAYKLSEIENDTVGMSEALRLFGVGSQFLHDEDTTTNAFLRSIELAGNTFPCQRAKSILAYADFLRKGEGAEKALKLLTPNAGKLFSCGQVKDFMYNVYVIGLTYEKLGQDTNAVFAFNTLLNIAVNQQDYFFQFKAYNSLLIVFLKLNKNPEYLFQAMMIAADKSKNPDFQAVGWNNMAKFYIKSGDTTRAEYCFDKSIIKSLETRNDENIAHISLNISMHYIRRGNYQKAIPLFRMAEERKQYIIQDNWLGVFDGIKAKIQMHQGNYAEAEENILSSLSHFETVNNYQMLIEFNSFAAEIFSALGKYDRAYFYQSQVLKYRDLFRSKAGDSVENNLYYKVLLDLEQTKAKTIVLENENLVKQRRIFFLLISVAIIVLLLAILFIYFSSNRYRRRILHSEQQKETLLAARIRLTAELNTKNKEIASFVLNQAMVNETAGDVITQMRQLGSKSPRETQKKLYELASQLSTSQNKNIWKEFDHYFSLVNPDFFSKLTQAHTGLTSRDLRYCALISLQLSSKEMALITGMTLQSIHVLRSRLRQKLAVDRDEDLGVYLSQYSDAQVK
ncbi:MAG: hypothetical protein A2W93_03285 [Bacteroidetes bacterium GWF2_43_63]|nr:MAG: hypothetical protein A2W94_09285 [Bacteroidetes bacterium GWE2_42_42]OFY53683.1 MAG: hypothetical protein A2W93_03285 [Bacteroidetes bacterium GWF2_43_63]HBG70971.1 hypothetical protein [Bacteroidales bacterium]HCB62938.1 hypothetical protein [Bacteroidales bacterium]HCY24298.1 hypothetical protein [Bacteroidales bacterium]